MDKTDHVSFVVLTLNNKDTIGDCLESILMQQYPRFDILVVDGGSKDGTIEIVQELMRKHSNLKLYEYPGDTIGRSRQIGVEKSEGVICAFLDSDCVLPNENWTKEMTEPFEDESVGGTWTFGTFSRSDPSIMRYTILCHPYRQIEVPKKITRENFLPVGTGHILLRKKAITEAGGFKDVSAGEDIDLIYRIVQKGYSLVYLENCAVYHYHVKSLREYLKKQWRNVTAQVSSKNQIYSEVDTKFLIKYVVLNLTLIYPITQAVKGLIRDRDVAWLWHPIISFLKPIVSGLAYIDVKR